MKNILVVGDFQNGSGLTNYLVDVYERISKSDVSITCLSYSGREEFFNIAKKHGWKAAVVPTISRNPIQHILEIKKFFKEHKNTFDVVHFNYSAAWNFAAVKFAKKYGAGKILVQSHNNYYSKVPKSRIEKFVLDTLNNLGKSFFSNNTDVQLAVSKSAAQWMFKNTSTVKIVKAGINPEPYRYDEKKRNLLRAANSISNEKKVIGFIGVLEDRKNPRFALNLIKKINEEQGNNYVLFIFGDGSLKEDLLNYVSLNHMENMVKFMGIVDNIYEWYSALDLFIFPSVSEGFGLVLLEAQANGLKSMVSDRIPNEAIVTDDVSVLPLNDTVEWIDELKSISLNHDNSENNVQTIKNNGLTMQDVSKKIEQYL